MSVLDYPSRRSTPFVHPGLLHNAADFERIRGKVAEERKPWLTGWTKLVDNPHSSTEYVMQGPMKKVVRGSGRWTSPDNFSAIFNDFAAAYQQSIRWKVTGDEQFARSATQILNSWCSDLTEICGNEDKYLAAGLYGYQLANIIEILRDFSGLTPLDLETALKTLVDVFYPMNRDFLVDHVGAGTGYYWANWDLCNILSMMSIGIVADRFDIYDQAVEYILHGRGNGSFENMFPFVYDDGTAQGQEAGRDQPHCLLDFCELGCIAQTAFNQGLDLFAYRDNILLKGAEYAAKYNLGHPVQYTPYITPWWSQSTVSPAAGRGELRPLWELIFHHYVGVKGLIDGATYIRQMRDKVLAHSGGAEGGGADYGEKSGGYDQLGFGTLLFTR